jgi:hypothetical protein
VGSAPSARKYYLLATEGIISCVTRKEVSVTGFQVKVRDFGEGIGKL